MPTQMDRRSSRRKRLQKSRSMSPERTQEASEAQTTAKVTEEVPEIRLKLLRVKVTEEVPEIRLKLLIDVRSKRILFAEAGKEFVDFMFSLLTLPIASVIKLLSAPSMTGCVAKLYESFEELSETYLLPNKDKQSLLIEPKINVGGVSPLLLSCAIDASAVQTVTNLSEDLIVEEDGGFVKGVVTYLVTDELEVKPLSAVSSNIDLINKYEANKDGVELEERVAFVGKKEGIELLKASLSSKTVLTDVFYRKLFLTKSLP